MPSKNTFIFYETIEEMLMELEDEDYIVFSKAVMRYGLHDIEPEFTGIKKALWTQIKFCIDNSKSYRKTQYENGCKGGRPPKPQKADNTNYEKKEIDETQNNPIKPDETQNNPNVNVNVNMNGNVNLNDDDDMNSECENQNLPPPPPILSEPQENYSKIVFEKFKNAGLPCQNGDFFRFQSCDFRLALQKLKGYHHNDILAAIDNYIAELKNPDSYVNQEYSFDNFIGTKTFSKCLPSNYRPQNFKIFTSKIPKAEVQTERHFYDKCLKCGVKMMEWKNPLQKYKCDSCGSTFSWEEVDNATEHYIVP